MSNIILALDAACEVQALVGVIRREVGNHSPDQLVIRGVAARLADLASAMVQALHDGEPSDLERLDRMIHG